MKIVILGAGSFGTALAVNMARHGGDVTLVPRRADHAQAMLETRQNADYLPGVELPDALTITADANAALACGGVVLAAMPMQTLRASLAPVAEAFAGKPVLACCKGIELGSGSGPAQVIADIAPAALPGVLTGPSFSHDLARDLPTAITLALGDDALGARVQGALSTPSLRLYRTTDVIGAQIGGALKNVMAIACGAAIGAGLGDSARAALMTRGFAEISRMAASQGGQAQTLAGLSGFGDLVLTCTSDGSRNYRFGLSLGRGEPFDPTTTVEGAATARAAAQMAAECGVDMPITHAVCMLAAGQATVPEVMSDLLSRPLKKETPC
jgi:glycerol-3-phosphate dehydrogenase (NAD(P)+)